MNPAQWIKIFRKPCATFEREIFPIEIITIDHDNNHNHHHKNITKHKLSYSHQLWKGQSILKRKHGSIGTYGHDGCRRPLNHAWDSVGINDSALAPCYGRCSLRIAWEIRWWRLIKKSLIKSESSIVHYLLAFIIFTSKQGGRQS